MYGGEGAQTTILYRLYNNDSGTHLFTVDKGQRDAILAAFPGIWVEHSPVGFAFNLQANGVLPGLDNFKPPTSPVPPAASAVAAPSRASATAAPVLASVLGAEPLSASSGAADLDVGLIQVVSTSSSPPLATFTSPVVETDDEQQIAIGASADDEDETESLDAFWSAFDPSALLLVGAE